jgi:phage shock protein C
MPDRLYRSRHDRMLAGVAGGLAETWDVDPSLVRIVWALLVIFTGGLALLVYIVMAIVVPEEGEADAAAWPAPPPPPPPAAPTDGGPTAGSEAPAGSDTASAATPPAASSVPPGSWVPPGQQSFGAREQARAARHEARAARRAARGERSGLPGSAIGGLVLVALGVFFLAREWLPQLDFDLFWPLILVGVGVLLVVSALSNRPDDPGGV